MERSCSISIPLPGVVSPGTLSGATATQIPAATSATATTCATRSPTGSTFSAKITAATTSDPRDAHDADGEEDEHQRPAAADAPGAVLDSHPERADRAVPPVVRDPAERRPAVPAGRSA